jgi:hypothetical protein
MVSGECLLPNWPFLPNSLILASLAASFATRNLSDFLRFANKIASRCASVQGTPSLAARILATWVAGSLVPFLALPTLARFSGVNRIFAAPRALLARPIFRLVSSDTGFGM